MKADQKLSDVLRQLRPSLHKSSTALSHLRPPPRFTACSHGIISKTKLPCSLQSQQSRCYSSFLSSRLTQKARQECRLQPPKIRCYSDSLSATTPAASTSYTDPPDESQIVPTYQLSFTCTATLDIESPSKLCLHRSTHRVSHQAYKFGSVLITCPSCKNRHVFADHLKIFADKSFTIEDILREKGESVKKGALEGDIEFWDDGTQTERAKL